MSAHQFAALAIAAPAWLCDAFTCYRRRVRTRRAVRLFRAMDVALEAGDRREAGRLFRHASAAVRCAR